MYKFHYEVMVPRFGSLQLCFTDTDSFLYLLHTDDLYGKQIPAMENHMDLSNYPSNHPLYSTKNKAVIGLFKDETEGRAIQEFVGKCNAHIHSYTHTHNYLKPCQNRATHIF